MNEGELNQRCIRVLIVDDEEEARNLLERLLLRFQDVCVVGKATSADEAVEMMINTSPELVFIDIQMPEKNGLQLVDYFIKLKLNTKIVFVTAHAEFAISAMKLSAFDYLLKPVLMEQLTETIIRYKADRLQFLNDHINQNSMRGAVRNCRIKFNTRTGYILVSPEDVMFCEADVNYTHIYMSKDNKETITVNLGRVEEIFAPYSFFRISRSILINRQYLSKADRRTKQCLLVKNGERIFLEIPPNHIRELEKLIDDQ